MADDAPTTRTAITYLAEGTGDTVILEVDAVLQEGYGDSYIVTEHPVERGAKFVDHVQPESPLLDMRVFLSNTPVDLSVRADGVVTGVELPIPRSKPDTLSSALRGVRDPVGFLANRFLSQEAPVASNAVVHVWRNGKNYVTKFYELVLGLANVGTAFNIKTAIRKYDNMVLQSIETERTKDTGSGLEFNLIFRHIRTVKSAFGTAPLKKSGSSKGDKGKQDPVKEISLSPSETASTLSNLSTGRPATAGLVKR